MKLSHLLLLHFSEFWVSTPSKFLSQPICSSPSSSSPLSFTHTHFSCNLCFHLWNEMVELEMHWKRRIKDTEMLKNNVRHKSLKGILLKNCYFTSSPQLILCWCLGPLLGLSWQSLRLALEKERSRDCLSHPRGNITKRRIEPKRTLSLDPKIITGLWP